MDLATALALSENPIALRLAQAVGLEATIRLARAMGITTPLQAVPGLVLGQSETTLLEMSGAFAVIANEGQRIPPMPLFRCAMAVIVKVQTTGRPVA